MTVRAKFKVDAIERTQQGKSKIVDGKYVSDGFVEMQTIKMSPVYGKGDPEHENTKFWAATPSGSLTLGTVNAEASAQFELGAEYYIDFTKAP